MGRLTIDITDQQHQSLKALAALEGKTIRQYSVEKLFPAQPGDDAAWRELQALLRQRIVDGLAADGAGKAFDTIVDEELSA